MLGGDADQVGGLRRDKTFLTISNTRGCGKLLVLEKLLSLWSQPGMDNKVTQQCSLSPSLPPLDSIPSARPLPATLIGCTLPGKQGCEPGDCWRRRCCCSATA